MTGEPIRGVAVFGEDPVQAVVFRPCCNRPERLGADALACLLPPVVTCERCGRLWTVELPPPRGAADRVAVWREQSRYPELSGRRTRRRR